MLEEIHPSQFHSVHLHEDMCKGCTICVTGCPVEAIRVHDGKAHILEEKCIDCGECIRRCPNNAKYALAADSIDVKKFKYSAALVAPAIYGQFNVHYSAKMIHEALVSIGFTEVFDVAEDALEISRATAELIDSVADGTCTLPVQKPLISSSCPTVIKLIQVRFPSLIENILPLLPPVELCARRARKTLAQKHNLSEEDSKTKIGIFLIAPCPAKITVARSPLGYEHSEIDEVCSIGSLYLPLVTKLRKKRDELKEEEKKFAEGDNNFAPVKKSNEEETADGIAWGRECGESEYISRYLKHPEKFNWITTCGLKQVIETLEAIEDGQLESYDFAEIDACEGGCLGGPLMVKAISESSAILRNRLRTMTECTNKKVIPEEKNVEFSEQIIPRPARQLSADFKKAKSMMEKLEEIVEQLPGLDCGSCGAPNCRALAEDIVRGKAHLEDCVTIMKSRYEDLLFGKKKK
ncbi:MAG: [Fe-Fe] hydrogenase large subunit C-terminal domain-containing protein [Treponema sp.]